MSAHPAGTRGLPPKPASLPAKPPPMEILSKPATTKKRKHPPISIELPAKPSANNLGVSATAAVSTEEFQNILLGTEVDKFAVYGMTRRAKCSDTPGTGQTIETSMAEGVSSKELRRILLGLGREEGDEFTYRITKRAKSSGTSWTARGSA